MKTSLQALLYVSLGSALRIFALHLPTAKALLPGSDQPWAPRSTSKMAVRGQGGHSGGAAPPGARAQTAPPTPGRQSGEREPV